MIPKGMALKLLLLSNDAIEKFSDENYKKFKPNIVPCKRKDIIKSLNFEIAKDASMNLNILKRLKS